MVNRNPRDRLVMIMYTFCGSCIWISQSLHTNSLLSSHNRQSSDAHSRTNYMCKSLEVHDQKKNSSKTNLSNSSHFYSMKDMPRFQEIHLHCKKTYILYCHWPPNILTINVLFCHAPQHPKKHFIDSFHIPTVSF